MFKMAQLEFSFCHFLHHFIFSSVIESIKQNEAIFRLARRNMRLQDKKQYIFTEFLNSIYSDYSFSSLNSSQIFPAHSNPNPLRSLINKQTGI